MSEHKVPMLTCNYLLQMQDIWTVNGYIIIEKNIPAMNGILHFIGVDANKNLQLGKNVSIIKESLFKISLNSHKIHHIKTFKLIHQ